MRALAAACLLVLLSACAPAYAPWGDGGTVAPRLTPPTADGGVGAFRAADGLTLPLRAWTPPVARFARPWAVVLALHGFNDYGSAFAEAGRWLADAGVAVYALDQRGFGAAPRPGDWAGTDALVANARQAATALVALYPDTPVYLMGESMGGAVVMAALASDDPPPVAGAVLSAPAVWGRSTMPWTYRLLMAVAVRLAPDWTLSGKSLGVWPSDNRAMLYALSRDPLVLKTTKVGALYGLTGLMDTAYRAGRDSALSGPVLWLYGARDEVIPPYQTLIAARGLDPARGQRFVAYPRGYHMLLRDLQGETVLRDILAWLKDRDGALPSGLSVDPATITIPGPPRPGDRSPGRIDPRTETGASE